MVCKATETPATALAMTPKYKNVGPEPKAFSVGEGQLLEIATASLPMVTRLGAGAFVVGYKASLPQATDDGTYAAVRTMGRKVSETSQISTFPRPAKPLELYEFEGCPFCKKVREAVTMLDLDVMMYPTPRDGNLWRAQILREGGKAQFPYLKDPNTGRAMYESDDIIRYLFTTYGDGEIPGLLTAGFLTTLSAGLGSIARAGKGGKAVPSIQPTQPLIMWGYEASPFVKVVREVLCEMQIPYLYRNCGRGSPKREELFQKYGYFQVPCLEDPNTESMLFESGAIIKYLRHQYTNEA